jgi:hypothetical protein
MRSPAELEKRIAELQAELAEAISKKSMIDAGLCRLAEKMHELFCKRDHEDECDWYREMDSNFRPDWKAPAHARWVQNAEDAIQVTKFETADQLYDFLLLIEETL